MTTDNTTELLARWEARALNAAPVDSMIVNRHIRELREALAAAPSQPVALPAGMPEHDSTPMPMGMAMDPDGFQAWHPVGAIFHCGQPSPAAVERKPLTDEQDRALCEASCNAAAESYFSARQHLDSLINGVIFYAGYRSAWNECEAAHGITAQQGEKT